jgi:hypothetical protein
MEQEEYSKEEINWIFMEFTDNKDVPHPKRRETCRNHFS